MILTKDEIHKLIKKKKVIIDPFDPAAVGPASIDLRIGRDLRIFNKGKKPIASPYDYKQVSRIVDIGSGYILKPRELVLGITKEKITLPDNICGWLNSRSRYARIGLMSHITAPFICPGISNRQVLDIYNASDRPILLLPNMAICQLILEECKGKAHYTGQFRDQEL